MRWRDFGSSNYSNSSDGVLTRSGHGNHNNSSAGIPNVSCVLPRIRSSSSSKYNVNSRHAVPNTSSDRSGSSGLVVVLFIRPVSYTHLTLPTIYSV